MIVNLEHGKDQTRHEPLSLVKCECCKKDRIISRYRAVQTKKHLCRECAVKTFSKVRLGKKYSTWHKNIDCSFNDWIPDSEIKDMEL